MPRLAGVSSTTSDRRALPAVYRRVVGAEAGADVAANGLRQVAANSLQSIGDQVVNAKTVLPWLLTLLGAPAGFTGLLVPVRESGSMLPQAALTPWVTSRPRRRGVWVLGALGQAAATVVLAATAAWAEGALAGVLVVAALAGFALSRSLCSLAGKDVLGRTVPKGQRGRITGLATTVSGVVALTLGLGLRLSGPDVGTSVLAALLLGAAVLWGVAAVVYAGVREPGEEQAGGRAEGARDADGWLRPAWLLLRDDAVFRRFVIARSLLLVSALAPPFVVAAAAEAGSGAVSGLAGFVVASGLANLIGGRLFGGSADRSSRRLMTLGAATASAVVLGVVVLLLLAGPDAPGWALVAAFFVLSLVHVGIRVGRKTYIVDAAEGDRRTEYVAVSNTAMGVLLLVVGLLATAVAGLGVPAALAFLGVLGLAGVVATHRLPEVSGAR